MIRCSIRLSGKSISKIVCSEAESPHPHFSLLQRHYPQKLFSIIVTGLVQQTVQVVVRLRSHNLTLFVGRSRYAAGKACALLLPVINILYPHHFPVIKGKCQGGKTCLSYQPLQRGGYNGHQHARKPAI
jgi:hypothetical protein